MTIEEVRASEPIEPLRENERGLLYATTTLDLPSLLTYSFLQRRLVGARLLFSDPSGKEIPPLTVAQAQRRFLYLRSQLKARYGDPIQKTVTMPRNVSNLRRSANKQVELAQQYDVEIAEAEERLHKRRALLESRFANWPNRSEMVSKGLASNERDLRDLRLVEAGVHRTRRPVSREHPEAQGCRPVPSIARHDDGPLAFCRRTP